jgi:hypothetical protein
MKRLLFLLPVVAIGAPVEASTPDAWAKFQLEVAQRCATASRLDHAHISELVGFDDSLGKVAALVTGRGSVRRGAPVTTQKKLCIYDKRARRAWVDDAPGWSAPDLR